MSIKELKGLTPWQWDRNTDNSSIGRKWLDEFEHVEKIHQQSRREGRSTGENAGDQDGAPRSASADGREVPAATKEQGGINRIKKGPRVRHPAQADAHEPAAKQQQQSHYRAPKCQHTDSSTQHHSPGSPDTELADAGGAAAATKNPSNSGAAAACRTPGTAMRGVGKPAGTPATTRPAAEPNKPAATPALHTPHPYGTRRRGSNSGSGTAATAEEAAGALLTPGCGRSAPQPAAAAGDSVPTGVAPASSDKTAAATAVAATPVAATPAMVTPAAATWQQGAATASTVVTRRHQRHQVAGDASEQMSPAVACRIDPVLEAASPGPVATASPLDSSTGTAAAAAAAGSGLQEEAGNGRAVGAGSQLPVKLRRKGAGYPMEPPHSTPAAGPAGATPAAQGEGPAAGRWAAADSAGSHGQDLLTLADAALALAEQPGQQQVNAQVTTAGDAAGDAVAQHSYNTRKVPGHHFRHPASPAVPASVKRPRIALAAGGRVQGAGSTAAHASSAGTTTSSAAAGTQSQEERLQQLLLAAASATEAADRAAGGFSARAADGAAADDDTNATLPGSPIAAAAAVFSRPLHAAQLYQQGTLLHPAAAGAPATSNSMAPQQRLQRGQQLQQQRQLHPTTDNASHASAALLAAAAAAGGDGMVGGGWVQLPNMGWVQIAAAPAATTTATGSSRGLPAASTAAQHQRPQAAMGQPAVAANRAALAGAAAAAGVPLQLLQPVAVADGTAWAVVPPGSQMGRVPYVLLHPASADPSAGSAQQAGARVQSSTNSSAGSQHAGAAAAGWGKDMGGNHTTRRRHVEVSQPPLQRLAHSAAPAVHVPGSTASAVLGAAVGPGTTAAVGHGSRLGPGGPTEAPRLMHSAPGAASAAGAKATPPQGASNTAGGEQELPLTINISSTCSLQVLRGTSTTPPPRSGYASVPLPATSGSGQRRSRSTSRSTSPDATPSAPRARSQPPAARMPFGQPPAGQTSTPAAAGQATPSATPPADAKAGGKQAATPERCTTPGMTRVRGCPGLYMSPGSVLKPATAGTPPPEQLPAAEGAQVADAPTAAAAPALAPSSRADKPAAAAAAASQPMHHPQHQHQLLQQRRQPLHQHMPRFGTPRPSGQRPGLTPELTIAPLTIPRLLSESECWQLARATPWLIQQEAARVVALLGCPADVARRAAARAAAAASRQQSVAGSTAGALDRHVGAAVPAAAGSGDTAAGTGENPAAAGGRTVLGSTAAVAGAQAAGAGGAQPPAAASGEGLASPLGLSNRAVGCEAGDAARAAAAAAVKRVLGGPAALQLRGQENQGDVTQEPPFVGMKRGGGGGAPAASLPAAAGGGGGAAVQGQSLGGADVWQAKRARMMR